jgi:hypothetical protein
MTKSPEEGQIWEWRAFGKINHKIAAAIESLPIRNNIRDLPGTDLYFIPPVSDQNVKLRLTEKGWVLKFKQLLEKQSGGIELYHETARWTYPFPISLATLEEAARLLGVTLSEDVLRHQGFAKDETLAAMAAAAPAVQQVEVKKVRSQYQFGDGWIEIASVQSGRHHIQSLSIHSPRIRAVEQMVEQLQPDEQLEAMNYVEACRRFN